LKIQIQYKYKQKADKLKGPEEMAGIAE